MKEIYQAETVSKVKRPLLEKDVQKQCVDWARARGYWARKFSSMTQVSVPDYLFAKNDLGNGGNLMKFAVEFKAPGKKATPAQEDEHSVMEAAGWRVYLCDDFAVFQDIVRFEEQRA
jgi:hypothetical protein